MTAAVDDVEGGIRANRNRFNITFTNLSYSVTEGRGSFGKSKKILHGVNGSFLSGHLTAILGPSGAGKTSLLNILAGIRTTGVTGNVIINKQQQSNEQMRRMSSYITQEFEMLPLLTTKEALLIAANLKLKRDVGIHKKNSIVQEILEILGLQKSINTPTAKLSGGEKKRLSIGLELITNPPIMFFDEPTSGLDGSSSYQIISHLKSLAETGRTIVCSIHQPSSRIFEMFDDLYVLSEGQCLYSGPLGKMTEVFEEAGFHYPQYYNRADFVIEVACREMGSNIEDLIAVNKQKYTIYHGEELLDLSEDVNEETLMLNSNNREKTPCHKKNAISNQGNFNIPWYYQFYILLKRSLLCTMRDLTVAIMWLQYRMAAEEAKFQREMERRTNLKHSHMARLRLMAHIAVGLLLGAMYYNVGNDATKVSGNVGCLFFFVMFLFYSNSMPTVIVFPVEAKVFLREHLNNWYSMSAYYFSKIFAEIPLQILCPTVFLGAAYFLTDQPLEPLRMFQCWGICLLMTIVGETLGMLFGAALSTELGIFAVPALTIPMVLFSGFFMKLPDVPSYLHWISYISFFRYSFEGLVESTYGNNRSNLECPKDYCYFTSPQKFLDYIGMQNVNYELDILALGISLILLNIGLYCVLKWKINAGK